MRADVLQRRAEEAITVEIWRRAAKMTFACWPRETELADEAVCVEAVLRPYAHAVEGWPSPLVDPDTQLTKQDAQRLSETGRVLPAGPDLQSDGVG